MDLRGIPFWCQQTAIPADQPIPPRKEQLIFLLFLKMAHERTLPPWNQPGIIPEEHHWPSLVEMAGIPLEIHYCGTLETLSKEPGMLRTIFRKGAEQGSASGETRHETHVPLECGL